MKIRTAIFISLIFAAGVFSYGAANLKYESVLYVSPTSPIAGDTVTCAVIWKAQSDDAVNTRIIGGIDGMTIFDQTFALVPAGETRQITFTWTATVGSHKAWFHMDPDNLTGDPYPQNNYIEQSFKVGSGIPGVPTNTITQATAMTAKWVNKNQKNEGIACVTNNDKTTDLSIVKIDVKDVPSDKYKRIVDVTFKNNGLKCVVKARYHIVDSFGQIISNYEIPKNPVTGYALHGEETKKVSQLIQTKDFNGKFETCQTVVKLTSSDQNTIPPIRRVTANCSKIRIIVDPESLIPESNESNNTSSEKVVIWTDGV